MSKKQTHKITEPLTWRLKLKILKLQSVIYGALAVNEQNCMRLAEEHCSRSYFSLFMSMTNHAGNGLLRSGSTSTSLKLSEYKHLL